MDASRYLSRRERVILAHLALPVTLNQIAMSLFVTRNTVKTQVRSIYRKLEVNDRESAVRLGRELGLVAVEPIEDEDDDEVVQQRGHTSTR
ncbi:LuxR C-terminal-related transcriptional regulator [Cellulomonas edaphi]|uniref:LuxR C-terminal-related transcriptional regulator n=1 Tax=Cellulomonas edaphi TaxID=3053468 RepID=A0ABT7S783_9CELL|nr:LuxR C-terminal-related transcriptional regulator [Cellulomons edaphi]MDM7831483.1 LuxR C-terminal-related transcriptional regulator [Cellulomons edaphi]